MREQHLGGVHPVRLQQVDVLLHEVTLPHRGRGLELRDGGRASGIAQSWPAEPDGTGGHEQHRASSSAGAQQFLEPAPEALPVDFMVIGEQGAGAQRDDNATAVGEGGAARHEGQV